MSNRNTALLMHVSVLFKLGVYLCARKAFYQ